MGRGSMLTINGKTYDKIVEYKLEKNQLWAEGSGRSYGDGSWNGTVLGNFTKPMVSLYFETPQELADFENVLVSGAIQVSYYDTRTRTKRRETFYRNNYIVKIDGYYDSGTEQYYDVVEVNFTPHKRD